MESTVSAEKRRLLQCLLDAVKQCQIRFGGKKELATDSDSRICVLCNAWENVLQHGLKHTSRAISTFKQLTEVAGLTRINSSFIDDIKNLETEPTFWSCVKQLLSIHELKRYAMLRHVNTDAGRGRAWLRASLNERSLEQTIPMLCNSSPLRSQFYEEWAFINDVDKSSTLSDMAAGLSSILFAINIDRPELNAIKAATGLDSLLSRSSAKPVTIQSLLNSEACPIASSRYSSSVGDNRKDRRKKRPINIVSFDADDGCSGSRRSGSPTLSAAYPRVTSSIPASETKSTSAFCLFDMDPINATNHDSVERGSALSVRVNVFEGLSRTSTLRHVMSVPEAGFSELRDSEDFDESHQYRVLNRSATNDSLASIDLTANNSSDASGSEANALDMIPRVENVFGDSCRILEQNVIVSRKMKTFDSASINSGNSTPSAGSYYRSDTIMSTTGDNLLPIDANGVPLSLDMVSLCDTTSESYGSYDSREVPAYEELLQRASLAVTRVQQALTDRKLWVNDDATVKEESSSLMKGTFSSDELKEAVVAMMASKEEIEERNRQLLSDLEVQKSLVSAIQLEMEKLHRSHQSQLEVYSEKNKSLTTENDLLKRQLKKYVSAVQLLRQQGARPEDFPGIHLEALQPAMPSQISHIDFSEEASEYERKLVQVAEMHGELMEFNDALKKQLLAYESQLKHLTDELVALRGPISSDALSVTADDELISVGWDSDSANFSSGSSPLVNIWIPSVFLHGSQLDGFHVYQIYVRIRAEEWNVYRRYSEFYELHSKLQKKHAILNTFDFPPKKAFGKLDPKVVEIRRKKLESYLRRVVNHLTQKLPEVFQNPSHESLARALPFFSDSPTAGSSKKKDRQSRSRGSQIPSSFPPTAQYTGL